MYTEPGLASQYFSIILTALLNQRPNTHNFLVLAFSLTVIIIVNLCFFISYFSLNQFLLISHQRRDLSCMPIEDLTLHLNNSILPLSRCFLSNIPCILRRCQCFTISTPIMAWSTILIAQINTFNNQGTINPALTFLMKSTDTAQMVSTWL